MMADSRKGAHIEPYEDASGESVLRYAVGQALRQLRSRDEHLLLMGASERSIVFRLASYLRQLLEDGEQTLGTLHVDSEYNRDGYVPNNPKKLSRITTTKCNAVFPDIIVHHRGDDARNMLVIEVKTLGGTKRDKRFDRIKLGQYRKQFGYNHSLFLVLKTGYAFRLDDAEYAKLEWNGVEISLNDLPHTP